jgi:hypothetical protein
MTSTLEHKSKAVAVRTETVTETPEKLYPNRAKLIALLNEHSTITNGISDFEAKLSRSQLDLHHAIDADSDVDIDRYQSQVSIYNVKDIGQEIGLNQTGRQPAAGDLLVLERIQHCAPGRTRTEG